MSNKKCHLPKGSTKIQKPGYDEIQVPAMRHQAKDEKLIPISSMP
jgi:pre-mRNA-splicing helicase BRR2